MSLIGKTFSLLFLYCCNPVFSLDLRQEEYFSNYCYDCHADGVDKGGVDFDRLLSKPSDHKNWTKIWEVIDKEQMPPADKKKQPTNKDREEMLLAIEKSIFKIDRNKNYSNPLAIYRMSTSQFANSLKIAFGYEGVSTMMLPTDATSMGFNNIASNLSVSPLHFESYRNIAFAVSREMFGENSHNPKAKASGDRWLEMLGEGEEDLLKLLRKVTLGAFRRPASEKEIEGFKMVFDKIKNETSNKKSALMETFRSIIISPSHIFRTELFRSSNERNGLIELDDYALVSRLSFFLWNSPPTEELYKVIEDGKLREKLDETLTDMLDHSNFNEFAKDFGQQWLNIQHIEAKEVSSRTRRQMIGSFKNETTAFIRYLFKENRPLSEMFTSRVSFINKSLAERYEFDGFKGSGYQKVEFAEDSHRRGILSHPSILYGTSNPDHTSPVKRGLWLLESILGMPPPPAPANVPQIEEAKKKHAEKELSHRELLALHRADKQCASCHEMMDPLGLAMENFSMMGEWREESDGEKIVLDEVWRGHKIKSFNDLHQLITYKFEDKFIKCLTEKLMIYALSRGLNIKDQIYVLKITEKLKGNKPTFQDVLLEIVKSTPFQYRSAG